MPGESGAVWEIDAKGVKVDGEGFVIVECRRHTTSRLSEESLAALAYRILDTRAAAGVVVTPLDIQAGAKKIAAHSNIVHITLSPESTTTEYVMKFLDRVFIGVADTCSVLLEERVTIEVFENGKLVDKRQYE